MRLSQVIQEIKSTVQNSIPRPIHLQSSPGLGKTSIVEQAAQDLGIEFKVVVAPNLSAEDYSFPVISADKTTVDFIVSKSLFPMENSPCGERGICLIDELAGAGPDAQKILAGLLHTKTIHNQKIKPGWTLVSAGNRSTDRSGATTLLRQLADRVTIIEVEASLDDWTSWALNNGVKPEVIGFLRFRPDLLNLFDSKLEKNATPRGWAQGVSARLGVSAPELEFEVFKGDVGEGPAAEFCAFLKIFRKLPSPDSILLNPTGAEVPSDPATLYALCGALAHKTTVQNFSRIMTYISRVNPEFSVLYVRDSIRKTPALQNTSDFIAWASGPGAKLLT